MKLLITGAAGFIGYHLTKRLADLNHSIVCIDNINDYYDVNLKYGRLSSLGFNVSDKTLIKGSEPVESTIHGSVRFIKMDICDTQRLFSLFSNESFDVVLHLAAQTGVRYSLINPFSYISSNLQGFLSLLESAKNFPPKHFVYASSSSVYGLNSKIPFSENDIADKPVSLYAATKRSGELMAYTYSHLYQIPITGLRFFTVYGPWGRPDMAPFIFAKSILEGKAINIFNNGDMKRDFTFVDDVVEGIVKITEHIPSALKNDGVPYKIYNIGNGESVRLMDFVHSLEEALGEKALLQYVEMQPGDVKSTWADCSELEHDTGFRPNTKLPAGIKKFTGWYKEFYRN
jgi:UDP-glucuronate 4-epimerase